MQHRPLWYLNRVLQSLTGWILLPANQVDMLVAVSLHTNDQLLQTQGILAQLLIRAKARGGNLDESDFDNLQPERRLH